MTEPNKEDEARFDFLMRMIREMQALRIPDTPTNEMSFIYKEGHESALDDALNVIRKEL
jgi:hypothetical protein